MASVCKFVELAHTEVPTGVAENEATKNKNVEGLVGFVEAKLNAPIKGDRAINIPQSHRHTFARKEQVNGAVRN